MCKQPGNDDYPICPRLQYGEQCVPIDAADTEDREIFQANGLSSRFGTRGEQGPKPDIVRLLSTCTQGLFRTMRGPSYNGILSQQPPYGCQVSVILSQMDAVCADVQGNFRIIVDDEIVFLLQGVVDVQLYIPYLQYRTDGRMRGIPSCSWQGIVPDKIIPARRFPFLTLKEGVIHSPHCVTRLIFRR